MIGTVGIRDLRIDCIVGIYPNEREREQLLLVDVSLEHDFHEAAHRDALAAAVDYDRVARLLTQLAKDGKFRLLETFAEQAAEALLAQYPQVRRLSLEVRKPGAVKQAACAFVAVQRAR